MILHILNGDGTAHKFRQTRLPGEVLVWREILSEGPAIYDQGEKIFWQNRQQYITQTYQVAAADYEQQVLAELYKLEEVAHASTEIVLWFEHDLLCQINLIYLLHWFYHRRPANLSLKLICINQYPGKPYFRGLGELSPDQLAGLFPQRATITPGMLQAADTIWKYYVAPTPLLLQQSISRNINGLPFLHTAIQAHFLRFPAVKNGLNKIEEILLQALLKSKLTTTQLLESFWQQESIFGVGDTQLFNYLEYLQAAGLISQPDIYQITELGRQALAGETDYLQHYPLDRWLGGVHLKAPGPVWRFDAGNSQFRLA